MKAKAATKKTIVDEYREIRLIRLELKKEYDKLEASEKRLKEQIIEELRKGIPHVGVVLIEKLKPTVEDWNALYVYIRENNAFELLHRRVTESAVQERWFDGVAVPGVTKFPVFDIKVG